MSGNGPRSSLTNPGPREDAGKTLIAAASARHAASTSVGVAQPGIAGIADQGRPGDQLRVEMRHDEEPCPGVDGPARCLIGQHGPGADLDPETGADARRLLQGSERVRLRLVERQLERPNAADGQRLGDPRDVARPERDARSPRRRQPGCRPGSPVA